MSQVANHMNAMRSAVVGMNARIGRLEAAGGGDGGAAAERAADTTKGLVDALRTQVDTLRTQVDALRKQGEAATADAVKQRKLAEAAATGRTDKQLAAGIHAAVSPLRESLAALQSEVAALAERLSDGRGEERDS